MSGVSFGGARFCADNLGVLPVGVIVGVVDLAFFAQADISLTPLTAEERRLGIHTEKRHQSSSRASLGLACAQATTLASQVFGNGNPQSRARRARD